MATVNSVLGPIDTKDLGFTLMHEHVLVGFAGVYQDYPELLGGNPLERAVDEFKTAKDGGAIPLLMRLLPTSVVTLTWLLRYHASAG